MVRVARLSEHRGARVKIRYSESDGLRVAESIMLSESVS